MLWVPGVDEIPMALGETPAPGVASIVVDEIGNGTKALGKMKPGDLVGVRSPYGNRFPAAEGRTLLVGGGIGVPSLVLVAQEAKQAKRGASLDFGSGARSGDLLAGLASVGRWRDKVHVCTDDGSRGTKGFMTDLAAKLLESHAFDAVMTCGPEIMLKKVVDLAEKRKVPVYASLERYMKCGIGICDQCTLGPGVRLCREGPILSGEQLKMCPEFGHEMRAPDGSRVPMHAARVAP
jgi:dihydroorotate dehydrogenase electron transfer subunit